jgi:hypothetical protein
MKALRIIKKVGHILYKGYSKAVDVVFNMLFFCSFRAGDMVDMYCDEHYHITSDGVIMRNE